MAKVIIVEDDPMISEIYQKKFTDSGFEVLAAESGEQALKLAKNDGVELVLTDLIMPKMDGFELIKNLRGAGYDPNIKIIVFSNLSATEDRDKALRLGANGFVAKSEFTPTELVKEVNRLLNQFGEQKKNFSRMEAEKEASVLKSKGKKILLIEDEEIILNMLGEKLTQDGFEVVLARNGAWGVKEALEKDFDLFIIDMVMPAMTGEEVVSKIKMEEKTKNIPIIVLSASVEDEVAKRVEGMGIEAFFVKTKITPSDLSKKVQELLNC